MAGSLGYDACFPVCGPTNELPVGATYCVIERPAVAPRLAKERTFCEQHPRASDLPRGP